MCVRVCLAAIFIFSLVSLNMLGVLSVCAHSFICLTLYILFTYISLQTVVCVAVCMCVCVCADITNMFSVCGSVPTAAQHWKVGIISWPTDLHLLSLVQSTEGNIPLKLNKDTAIHHATANPLSPATHTSHVLIKY